MERNAKHVLRAAEIEAQKQPYSHPWNPASELHGVQLGRTLGLARTGVNFAVLPPGKESFVYHSHTYEEEWLYILSGRGRAEVGARARRSLPSAGSPGPQRGRWSAGARRPMACA